MEMTQEVWDRIQALENKIVTIEASQARLYVKATDSQSAPASAKPTTSAAFGHPALLRRLHKHGIRLHPEDMDDFDGSGSEKYASVTDWTKDPGQGLTHPGLPTQAQANAVTAQAAAEEQARRGPQLVSQPKWYADLRKNKGI